MELLQGCGASTPAETYSSYDNFLKLEINVTVPGKRDQFGNFFKIELLLPQGRVGFELQNALHI